MKKGILRVTLCLICLVMLCGCGKSNSGTKPGTDPDPVSITLTGADGGSGAEANPWTLSLTEGDERTLTVAVQNSETAPQIETEGEAIEATLTGGSLAITAKAAGSAKVTIFVGEELSRYLRVTVTEKVNPQPKPVVLTVTGTEGGNGTESSPLALTLAEAETRVLSYTLTGTQELPAVRGTNDVAQLTVSEGKITVAALSLGTALVEIWVEDVSVWLQVTVADSSSAVTGIVAKYGAESNVYEGVLVKISSPSYEAYSVTDEDGAYWFTHLQEGAYTVSVILEAKYASFVSDEAVKNVSAAEFNNAEKLVSVGFTILPRDEAPTTRVEGKVTSAGTGVGGMTLVAGEQSAETKADGSYVIEGVFAFADITVSVVTDGSYAPCEKNVNAEDVVASGVTQVNLELGLPFYNYGVVCGNSGNKGFYLRYTRNEQGFVFSFTPQSGVVEGNIQLWIDTKESTYDRNNTDYYFNLTETQVVVSSYGGHSPAGAELLTRTIAENSLGGEVVYFSVPYAFFAAQGEGMALSANEVIGISLGYQVSAGGVDWIGWVDSLSGGGRLWDNRLYVAPEHPVAYMRLAPDNTCYRADMNVYVDFSGYKGSFGYGNDRADAFYVNVEKTAEGLKMDFITTGNFGGKGETDEFVCLYLDLDGVQDGGWNFGANDRLFKLYGDGTVRYKGGSPWWTRNNADGVLQNMYTVKYENAVTTFTCILTWEQLGISANTAFGFAFREARDTAVDMEIYGDMGEFVYNGQRVADTAMQSGYIRSDRI